jgi:hypothetical protein
MTYNNIILRQCVKKSKHINSSNELLSSDGGTDSRPVSPNATKTKKIHSPRKQQGFIKTF